MAALGGLDLHGLAQFVVHELVGAGSNGFPAGSVKTDFLDVGARHHARAVIARGKVHKGCEEGVLGVFHLDRVGIQGPHLGFGLQLGSHRRVG